MATESVKYLLVGGGTAAAQAAVGIRELDKDGTVLIVARENHIPYDRPPLSKGFVKFQPEDPADIESKDSTWYPQNNVSLRTGTEVTRVDRDAKAALLSDGSTVAYEKLLLATGSTPRSLDIPGSDMAHVFTYRTVDDAQTIREMAKGIQNVVLVGGGYIGMELGATLRQLGKNVTIIHRGKHPWDNFASAITGNFLQAYFENQGVRFLMEDEPEQIAGNGRAQTVRTKKGHAPSADLVIVGVGVELNTSLAQESGLSVDKGIPVNEYLQSEEDPSVWVAGDIAAYTDRVADKRWHAEHHMNAKWTGKQAGRNMAGANEPFSQVAYFFSDMFDLEVVLRGSPGSVHSTKVLGDLDTANFVELYSDQQGVVRMAIGVTRDNERYGAMETALEKLVLEKRNARDVTPADAGLV
ncbi:MAG: NAD(P)/FAD-dependent oxidoreductase [Fimbriimonas sp.]